MTDTKCVILLDETLPMGLLTNAAAALSMSIGKLHPELIGYDLMDADGITHLGITTVAIPVLKASNKLTDLRHQAAGYDHELTIVDLVNATTTTKSYDQYASQLQQTASNDLVYYGLAMYGPKKLVNKITGSLGLIR